MYESGNEDKINESDNTIKSINDKIEQKSFEDLQRENQTLKQMVENRNQEIKKENSEDKITALSNVLGINKMKAQIDELNQGQNSIIGKLSEVINGMNNITQAVNGNANNPQAEPMQVGDPMQKIELISNLIDKLGPLYTIYKQNQNPPSPQQLIDPEYINQKVKNSIMGNFELGEALIDSLKSKVINKALTKTVSQIIDNDEPA